jgi:hypothetical protein
VDVYLVVLRIVHIVAGVFWVGAVLLTFFFLQPPAREIGPAAGPLMTHLAEKKLLPDVTNAAAGLTLLAGALMYWRVSDGFDPDWIGSSYGIGITVWGNLRDRRNGARRPNHRSELETRRSDRPASSGGGRPNVGRDC